MSKAITITFKKGGGLCNKLFCLFSACDIAIKNDLVLIEPYFGWKRKILFSDIYDIDFFNDYMKQYNNNKIIMVKKIEAKVVQSEECIFNLWGYSEDVLKTQRSTHKMKESCMNIVVLKALRLNKTNENIMQQFPSIIDKTGIHIRTEHDWVVYSRKKKKLQNEVIIENDNNIIQMYVDSEINDDVFFTSGEHQKEILSKFTENNINSFYFFDNTLEYEINAAINFELCVRSKVFIGLSRSTYSNLITLKRSFHNKESYIYNYQKKILKRIDKGLHPNGELSISKEVEIIT